MFQRLSIITTCFLFACLTVGGQAQEKEDRSPTKGGGSGKVVWVTNREDSVKKPPAGSLRWALQQKGVKVVKFRVNGDIRLKGRIILRHRGLTIDGTDAPGGGITLRDGAVELHNAEDVILRNIRIRLGPEPAKRQRQDGKRKRPKNSVGLDCLSLNESRRVLIENCSLSESCDELLSVVRSQDVLVRNCLFSDPLAGKKLHPYGDNHGFCLNASASILRIENSVFAHYVMRGPQFECNDMGKKDRYTVRMEAVNNIMFDFGRSGARYSLGVEKNNGVEQGKSFEFVFRDNLFISNATTRPALEAITTHGTNAAVKVESEGNQLLQITGLPRFNAATFLLTKGSQPSLRTENLRSMRTYQAEWQKIATAEDTLANAGCMPHDKEDRQVAENIRNGIFKY